MVNRLGLSMAALMMMTAASAADVRVRITPELAGVDVLHEGIPLRVQRNQQPDNTIDPRFQRTSRPCPPFCIQPMRIADGVETIGETEMLDYLQRVARGDDSVLIIDSRGPSWLEHGTIPGSINIHYKRLSLRAAQETDVAAIVEREFGAEPGDLLWNFANAKTLVLFCNGPWCGQSPTNIRALLRLGYPAERLKWYRGGMQAWESVGLTTVLPKPQPAPDK